MGVITFQVVNQSAFHRTFTFLDEANNNQATYSMNPNESRPLSLATKDGGDGWMKYRSNPTGPWTEKGWIKQGDIVVLY